MVGRILCIAVRVWLQHLSGPAVPISMLVGDVWLCVRWWCERGDGGTDPAAA